MCALVRLGRMVRGRKDSRTELRDRIGDPCRVVIPACCEWGYRALCLGAALLKMCGTLVHHGENHDLDELIWLSGVVSPEVARKAEG